ncbi:Bug family tripartite tricarboxylate transporter substrate binding protein [Frigidibacter sp. MR17.24]|uniref:Bug family tripartite tricarboxylate transporter substrate binding protein n=1 Tax=Frigidibacter sp. MR17.24 TaxID=3127345 RepID=UPI003012C0C9
MTLFSRRSLVSIAGAALLVPLAGALPAHAQSYPDHPVTIVVAWPAGGSHDLAARLVAEHLTKHMDATFVIKNVPGAAGSTGVREVETAAPDGYTIGVMGLHAIAQSYMNPNATALDKIAPLAVFDKSPAALTVGADTGIDTLADFVAKAKEEPGAIVNSTDGPGGFAFLTQMVMQNALGIELTNIPYQGFAPAVAAMASGETMATTVNVASAAPLMDAGSAKILGVAGTERHFRVPEVPTFEEAGFPFVFADFIGFFLPVGVDPAISTKLETAMMATAADPAFVEAARNAGLVLAPGGAAEFAAFIKAQDEAVYPVLEAAGLVEANARP